MGGADFQDPKSAYTVLVVDDDQMCLDQYCDLISNLGYKVVCAGTAPDALKQIAESPDIGVVITDIEMPSMDGLSLLQEIADRFLPSRPIVSIVITAHSSLQIATKAMQSQATDFLCKPVMMEDLAATLRQASARHLALANRFQITELKNQLSLSLLREDGGEAVPTPTVPELQSFMQMLLKLQHNKSKFFDSTALSGPSWEILLDIAEASLRGEAIQASSVSATLLVSLSTTMRHVNNLVAAGLVQSWTDPSDKRRTMLKLQPDALEAMRRYLEMGWKLHAREQTTNLNS
ncbi:response regulator [Sphingorhabdus sp.]|uniref:response regulator n=1 Tax=Sphingorhabdus sp. TaxID=1902408 RepID=UPI00391C0404